MTKREALERFKQENPAESYQRTWTNGRRSADTVARAEDWGAFTDALCKEGRISLKQYEGWACPF